MLPDKLVSAMTWCYPAYGESTFDLLPNTIEQLLTGSKQATRTYPVLRDWFPENVAERVVLVYLDAFGWQLAERHREHRLLQRARDDGLITKMTSQFPSTTTVHTTTIHSALPVAAHGLYEWFVYEPSLDRMICPLLFSFAGDNERGTLPLSPEDVFPTVSLYQRLAKAGVASHVVFHDTLTQTPPTRLLAEGARVHGFSSNAHAVEVTRAAFSEPGYAFLYLDDIDALMHDVGPDDPAVFAATDAMLTLLETLVDKLPPGTLFLLVSDHGMAAIDPATTLYVNQVWPEIAEHLKRGEDRKPLAPGGSARDLFLHVHHESVAKVIEQLGNRLEGKAEVRAVSDLLERGVFGSEPSELLRSRLADVVVLPYSGESVWWYEPGRFEQTFRGQHGGLTPEEMEIPLIALVA